MDKIPDNCEDCFARSICAETNIRGKGVCLKFYKLVEEKFKSTNKQSAKSCEFCADPSPAENSVCNCCLDRLIREGA